jgi:hypothetical protein
MVHELATILTGPSDGDVEERSTKLRRVIKAAEDHASHCLEVEQKLAYFEGIVAEQKKEIEDNVSAP